MLLIGSIELLPAADLGRWADQALKEMAYSPEQIPLTSTFEPWISSQIIAPCLKAVSSLASGYRERPVYLIEIKDGISQSGAMAAGPDCKEKQVRPDQG